ncbi:MAG: TonB-dependent receptor [Candidatus Eisenbacteria bacterium]|uniref:TonB-dependent receptor n=1 Tax=Eiseniibacteriota bacterium TaxID=2212470 RepID=A0A933SAC6_UNCEI|nr:TonB-dependent receptor [Candidatus Eisenbacteria bacterium]
MRRLPLLLLVLALSCLATPRAFAAGIVRGQVLAAETNQPLAAVRVQLQGARLGALTDERGRFTVTGVPAGVYNVEFSLLGRRREVRFEIAVTPGRPVSLEVALEEEVVAGDSVTVVASPFRRPAESPVSVQNIGAAEIERFPGGNRDISRVIQSLPGVASAATYRNDVLVRGGAPNENRFFVDGVEVPVINHFATQGSSGGPVGMIDVNFVQDVDLFTSAFPASRGNALSSVMEFHMKDGNDDRLARSLTVGASDFGVTLDGPVGAANRVIFSARRSYLQYLASVIGLPFLPTYTDAQLRWHWHPNDRDQFAVLAIGAIDQFELNTDATDTEFQRWVLDNLPETPQWNYTTGATWKHLGTSSVRTLVVSRSMLDNRAKKYFRNDESSASNLLLDYRSREAQTRARAEWTKRAGAWRWIWGAGADRHVYTNSTFQRTVTPAAVLTVDFDSRLVLATGSAFAQATRAFARERFTASLGLRADAADFSRRTSNPLDQLSPRLSGTWQAAPAVRVSASAARYRQLPPYTVLGYRDGGGTLVNRASGVTWIRADHLVAGAEWTSARNSRLTAEAFFKRYADYPYLTRDSISLANLGADYGVIGNAPADARSRGRAYGFEVLAQQRLHRGWYGIAAYTFVRSEFTNGGEDYVNAAWDNRHVVSVTGGRRFARGWEIGGRWRLLGGAPYTPDDVARSSLREVWDVTGRAVPDTRRINAARAGVQHQLDVRVDKQWPFRNGSLQLYLDVQNAYAFAGELAPTLAVRRGADGEPLVDPDDSSRYLVKTLEPESGTPLPTIGLRWNF